MKRIRTLTILAFVICVTIGSFYIYADAAAKGYPQFYIKKEAGDEKEINSLTLTGSLLAGGVSDPVTISAAGSKYNWDLSFMERFNSLFSYHDGLETYRNKYRSFMRGKESPNSFYEDSRSLVFAGVNYNLTNLGMRNFSFTISQLNKANEDESSFQVKVPEEANYMSIGVADVQKHDGQLDVITLNSASGEKSSETEIHCYQFDLKNKKLLSDKTIFSTPDAENNKSTHVSNLMPTSEMAPEEYYVFFKDSDTMSPDGGNNSGVSHTREIYAYHFATKTLQKIPFPKEISEKSIIDSTVNYYHGPLIYFATPDSGAKGVKVISYNIETNKLAKQYTIPMEEMGGNSETTIQLKKNRIYVLMVNHDIPTNYVVVGNLENGKVLYKGKVIPKPTGKSSNLQSDASLYVQTLIMD